MPASANPSHVQQRKYARSKIPQADYQTATTVTVPANIVAFPKKDKGLAKHEVRTEDNKGDALGFNWATEEYVTEHDTSASHELRVCSEEIGRDLLDAFGADAVTQPDAVGSPTVYKHVFAPLNLANSKQLPARTLVEIVGAGLNRLLPSMVCESLELKGEGNTHVAGSRSDVGSGKVTAPSGITASAITNLTGLHYFTNTMVKLTISDAGTQANALAYGAANRLDTWAFRVKNNLLKDQGYVPGDALYQTAGDPATGAIRSELLVESQEFEVEAHARFAAQSDQLAALRTRKALDVLIELTGPTISGIYKHKLSVKVSLARYDMVELDEKDNVVHVQLKFKLFFDTASGNIASVELTNTVASYTA